MTRLRSMLAATTLVVSAATPGWAAPAAVWPSGGLSDTPVGLTYDFTSRIVTTDQTGAARDHVTLRGKASILGDKVRIDIADAGAGNVMNGAYMLAYDGGRKLYWVNPGRKVYYEVESAAMMGKMDQLVNGSNGLIKAEASNVKVDVKKMGAGPVIEGHETVHYRMTQRMDMKTKVLYRSINTHDESTIDYYYAPDLQHFVNPFLSSSQDIGGAMTFLGDEYMRQIQAAYSKLYQGGAPLKTVMSSRSTDEFGNVRTSTITTEVSNLKSGMLSEAMFAIPNGYSQVQSAEALQADPVPKAKDTQNSGEKVKSSVREPRGRPE